jgi:hypothetical protein
MFSKPPEPRMDWITQRRLVAMLGISEKTGSLYAQEGKFRRYEHSVPGCGRRKYSKLLVERQIRLRLEQAVRLQDTEF